MVGHNTIIYQLVKITVFSKTFYGDDNQDVVHWLIIMKILLTSINKPNSNKLNHSLSIFSNFVCKW